MKNIISKFKELPVSKKIQLIAALVLTVVLFVSIPVYAWFTNQKKAAELFKVQYPNSLYINAAHREDQAYFKLDGINFNQYLKDPITNQFLLDENEKKIKITKLRYVFAVSGSSTNEFTLQMAHTTNNNFNYKIYEAMQFDDLDAAKSFLDQDTTENEETNTESQDSSEGLGKEYVDKIVVYKQNANSHNENKLLVLGDEYVDASTSMLYYVIQDELSSEKIGYKNRSDSLAIKDVNNNYYNKTYGTNTNVESHAVPLYWQGNVKVTPDSNKIFCKYFVLEVTCGETPYDKETDMIYFSVRRFS
jgi:hypothetical protein